MGMRSGRTRLRPARLSRRLSLGRSWRHPGRRALAVWLALLIWAVAAPFASAVTQLQRDMEAPAIALTDSTGQNITNQTLRDHAVVLIFGELYHDKTREACTALDAVLKDSRLAGQSIVAILATTRGDRPGDAPGDNQRDLSRLSLTITEDPGRKTFGAFQVAVMPSVVVIDPRGRIVYAMAGMVPRFSDLLTDALLYAAGKLSVENLDRSLQPQPATQQSDVELRSERIALLARQLMHRGLDEMAAEKYREALTLNPRHPEAHLELASLLLKHERLADAESQFRAVLADQPDSMRASLGVAFVQTLRGGGELDDAEKTVRGILARSPSQPRAYYLLGRIQEQRKKGDDAAASYRKAAELLLERAGAEEE